MCAWRGVLLTPQKSRKFQENSPAPRLGGRRVPKGELADPIAGTGADYVYISINASFFPTGEQVAKRSEIEDAAQAALESLAGGRWIGGALGTDRGYCDLPIFDGARSLAAIEQALRGKNVPAGTMIEFFAKEKRSRRIAL